MLTDDSVSSDSPEPTALFEKGEIVWAKAFPQPWCPCRIVKATRSRVLLSPFGWDTTRWLPVSDIRKFEVNYCRMLKSVGVHLSGEIRLAVEELRRRTYSALMCPCRGSSDVRPEREVARVRMGFKPRELLDFVIDMGVDPWVDDEEGIVAARVSVQVDAFRCYRSVMASGGIHPAVADVSMEIENEGTAGDCVEVAHEEATAVEVVQFDACQEDVVISERSLGRECEGGDRELSYSPSRSRVVYGVNNPSDDFSIKLHEEECEVSQEPASEGAYTCLINSVDFSIFDSDEDSGSLLDNQPLSVTDGIEIPKIVREGTIEKQNSWTGSSLQESLMGTPCCKSSSHAEDSCENVGSEAEFHATSVDSSETKLENREYEATTTGEHEISDFSTLLLSSPHDDRTFLSDLDSHCETQSSEGSRMAMPCCTSTSHIEYDGEIVCNETQLHASENFVNSLETKMTNRLGEGTISVNLEISVYSPSLVSSAGSLHRTTPRGEGQLFTDLASPCDTYVTCCEISSRTEDNCENVGIEFEHYITKRHADSFETKMANQLDELTMMGEHKFTQVSDPSAFISTAGSLQRTKSCDDGNLPVEFAIPCDTHSSQESDMGTSCCVKSSHAEDKCEDVDNASELSAIKRVVDYFETKMANRQVEAIMTDERKGTKTSDLSAMLVSSADSFHRTDPCGQFLASPCDTRLLEKSAMGTTCCKTSSYAEDSYQNVGSETVLHVTERPVNSIESKVVNRQDEITMEAEHEMSLSSISVVSLANSSQRTAPCDEEELLTGVASHCDTLSPTEKFNNSANFLPSPSANLVGSAAVDETYTANVILCPSPRATTASERVDRKRRHDSTFTGSNSSKLHKTMTPSSDARIISKHGILAHHIKETLPSTNADGNVAMSHMGDAHSIVSGRTNAKGDRMRRRSKEKNLKSISSATLSGHASMDAPWKGLAQCLSRPSQWHKFYVSPLVRDTPISTGKGQKSSVTDKSSSLSKSLHMKFPKDFDLPSKEELEKKFSVFGPLDSSKSKIYSSTGAGRVVFLKSGDAKSAYKHVRKRNIFGLINVRFWVDEYENSRKLRESPDVAKPLLEHSSPSLIPDRKELSTPIVGQTTSKIESCIQDLSAPVAVRSTSTLKSRLKRPGSLLERDPIESRIQDLSAPVAVQSTSTLKSCLKRPGSLLERDPKKRRKVRFLMVTN